MSWPARMAFSSWGTTVSSKPRTPGTSVLPSAMSLAVLRRISSATETDSHPLARRSASEVGRLGRGLEAARVGGGGRVELVELAAHEPSLRPVPVFRRSGNGGMRRWRFALQRGFPL